MLLFFTVVVIAFIFVKGFPDRSPRVAARGVLASQRWMAIRAAGV